MLRFAVSPTKDLSLGDLRIAIFNHIVSKQLNEDLVLRIDDANKEENIEGKDKDICEILNLFAIDYKNVVHQSDSLKYHQKLAMQLMANKKAFSCFCGDSKLEELKNEAIKNGKIPSYDGFCETLSDETVLNTNAPFTVRITKPTQNISFDDNLKGKLEFTPDEIDYFVILNHSKFPTYNYACAMDDMIMDVSTVIRSDLNELNTCRQIHIRNLFGYDKKISYTHIPAISNDMSVKSLIDEGFLPSAIANYIMTLGYETPEEIFTLEDALKWFDIKKLSKDEVTFDIEKLKEFNKKHLETLEDMRFSKILGFADEDLGKLAKLYISQASTINEIKKNIELIFSEKTSNSHDFNTIKECLKTAPYIENYDDLLEYISKNTNLTNFEDILRVVITNCENGPDLDKIYPLIKNYLGEIIK